MNKYNIDLEKQGQLYVAFCPFHRDENRPNFTVYVQTNSYFCFTCNEGGDAVDFYARMENIPRAEAITKLFSGWQDLIDKINYEPPEKSYNELINLQISRQFKTFLSKYPHLLSEVKKIMKEIDERLQKDIDQQSAVTLVNEVNSRLNKLKPGV